MALIRGKREDVPDDAVPISSEEAFAYQWKIVESWDKASEVWSLRYAPEILGGSGAITGIYMNNYYRKKLKLGNYGKLSTYLPIVVMPAITTVLYHKFLIQKEIVLEPMQCPTCLQLKAAAFQASLGVIYPTLLAPIACFMFATRHFTFRLPPVTEKPLEVLQIWRKMTKPLVPMIGFALSVNAIIAIYITFKESQQHLRMQLKIKEELQSELDNIEENTL